MWINDIKIDWCSNVPTIRSSDLLEHPVESKEMDRITSHIKNDLPEFTVFCILNGEDRNYKFDEIDKLWREKSEVTLKSDKIIENLRITLIEENSRASNVIEFRISFKKVAFASYEEAEITQEIDKRAILKIKENLGKKKPTFSNVTINPADYDFKGEG